MMVAKNEGYVRQIPVRDHKGRLSWSSEYITPEQRKKREMQKRKMYRSKRKLPSWVLDEVVIAEEGKTYGLVAVFDDIKTAEEEQKTFEESELEAIVRENSDTKEFGVFRRI